MVAKPFSSSAAIIGGVEFVAGLGVDLAGLGVDLVARQVAADQGVGGKQQGVETRVGQALGLTGGDLHPGLGDFLAGVGVDQRELRLHTAPALGLVGRGPAVGAVRRVTALEGHHVIEGGQDLLAVHAEREHEGRRRQLPTAVDAAEDNVLGVELEVEPGAAIGDHPGGEEQLARGVGLALVVVEEHARRAVHLGDDHPLGAVHDERALVGHERDVAHVDVLLLDVLHGAGLGVLVDFPDDQAQLDLQRRGIGHVALDAFLDVVLRVLELVGDVFEHGALVEVLDREDRAEHRFQALVPTLGRAHLALEELLVGRPLHLDQVRHAHGFGDTAEGLADALASSEGLAVGGLHSERLRHQGLLGFARGLAQTAGARASVVLKSAPRLQGTPSVSPAGFRAGDVPSRVGGLDPASER